MSTTMHLQTDGQTERVQQHVRSLPPSLCGSKSKCLGNSLGHCAILLQLDEVRKHGKQPIRGSPWFPTNHTKGHCWRLQGQQPTNIQICQRLARTSRHAKLYLEKSAKRIKKWPFKKHTHWESAERDQVLVKLYEHGRVRGLHKGLMRRYEGPFTVIKKVGSVAYKLELPEAYSKLHSVFHVSLFKPHKKDPLQEDRNISTRAPTGIRDQYDKAAKEILSKRITCKRNRAAIREYLVKWKGLPISETSWGPVEHLWQFQKLIGSSKLLKHRGRCNIQVGENDTVRLVFSIQPALSRAFWSSIEASRIHLYTLE